MKKILEFTVRRRLPLLLIAGFLFSLGAWQFGWLDSYVQLIVMYIGINIILTLSLNLVNGYMGEFSVGHAAFMSVGAYTASLVTVKLFADAGQAGFVLAILCGGAAAGLAGLLVAIPSFKTRGDYLAIVTLALNVIVKSVIENINSVGGPRGFMGMDAYTTLPWVFVWTVLAVWIMRNFVYSDCGRGAMAIREDEIAAELMGVNTRQVKIRVFALSAFFAGVAGGLFAHLIQYINPGAFDILKSTEILTMVYLGGVGSIAGSIAGAVIYTVLLEALRFMGVWRMAIMPLILVALMLFRRRGLLGYREFSWFVPRREPKP